MDKSENTPKPRYLNEYRKMGDIFGYRPSKEKNPWDKVLLQVFTSLIALAIVLLINTINLDITRTIANGIKKTLNWQMNFQGIEQTLKSLSISKGENEIDENEIKNDKDEILKSNTSTFLMPIDGEVTSPFGERIHPVFNTVKVHYGIDIDGNFGDKIKASMEGNVSEIGEDSTLGKYVKIKNGIYETLYAHCSKVLVKEGQKVKQNEVIAEVGDTGLTSGPHLHFEIWADGKAVDPLEIIK
jgi:murein DD-endopeptidase MepM/ murein hydrolase activator NlpD